MARKFKVRHPKPTTKLVDELRARLVAQDERMADSEHARRLAVSEAERWRRILTRCKEILGIDGADDHIVKVLQAPEHPPFPMRLHCPACHALHVDKGEFITKAHHTHACQWCGMVWRPALVATVGVEFLPGFKDEAQAARGPCTMCGGNPSIFQNYPGQAVTCPNCGRVAGDTKPK